MKLKFLFFCTLLIMPLLCPAQTGTGDYYYQFKKGTAGKSATSHKKQVKPRNNKKQQMAFDTKYRPKKQKKARSDYKKVYLDLGFVNSSLKQEDWPELKSNFGASLSLGKTFYLHKDPIADAMKFGIDATWFDLTYTNYDVTYKMYWRSIDNEVIHEAELGMQVGPSLTIKPLDKMNIHLYFRLAPCYSYYIADHHDGKYATYFVGGGSVSYRSLGLGIELRQSSNRFDSVLEFDGSTRPVSELKTTTSGIRAYITFKF